MEAIEIELSEFTLRCRSLLLSHRATSSPRGLEPGEQVVLRDPVRGHYAAHVADLTFEPSDTVYRLALGARLTDEEARERLLGRTAPVAGTLTKQDLLDLLGQLRAAGSTVPAARHRRTDTAL
jgi:hypothetical protein